MSKIKFSKEIKKLIKKRNLIPDEFWVWTEKRDHQVIWFMDRQKPSVEASYDFDMERFGITRDGRIIWGFDSGCSCPTPFEGGAYETKEWKEFEVSPETAFDREWEEQCYETLKDFLKLIDSVEEKLDPIEVLSIQNAEVRRFIMKRIGYEHIKKQAGATLIHKDGDSELLKFKNGDVYVKVKDSSTEREYLLSVPENTKTCKGGIAWTFGLREEEYKPEIET